MRNIRNKYSRRPKRPWDSTRIDEEKGVKSEYGLRRKKEIRSAEEILRTYRQRARKLIAIPDEGKEKILITKLLKLGMLKDKGAGLDNVLALARNDILDRRLQTVVFRKGMGTTPMQARQHIIHGHISIEGRRTDIPSYLVPVDEESKITWHGGFKPKKQESDKGKRGVVKKPEGEPAEAPAEETQKATKSEEVKEETNGGEENSKEK